MQMRHLRFHEMVALEVPHVTKLGRGSPASNWFRLHRLPERHVKLIMYNAPLAVYPADYFYPIPPSSLHPM